MVSIPTALKPEEVRAILEALCEPGYEVARDMFVLALHTGMEAGNLTDLRWTQVDLFARVLKYESRGKQRTLPMSTAVYSILARLSAERSSETFVFGMIPDNVKVSVRKVWHEVAERVGVPNFGLRTLRYTCLERMTNHGLSISTVYAFVGLSSRNYGRKVKAVPIDVQPAELDRIWEMETDLLSTDTMEVS